MDQAERKLDFRIERCAFVSALCKRKRVGGGAQANVGGLCGVLETLRGV